MKAAIIEVKFCPSDPRLDTPVSRPGSDGFVFRIYAWHADRPCLPATLKTLSPRVSGAHSGTTGRDTFDHALSIAKRDGFTHYLPHGFAGKPITFT